MPEESVEKWVQLANTGGDLRSLMNEVNMHMETRTFLVGNELSAADEAVYKAIHAELLKNAADEKARLSGVHVWRWFDLIQHRCEKKGDLAMIDIDLNLSMEQMKIAAVSSKKSSSSAPGGGLSEEERAAKAAQKKAAKEAKKAAKKDKPGPTQTPKREETLSVSRLDIRVANILKAENHPDADGLYLEQIDVGDDKPRTVCSGLRKFFTTPDLLLGPCLCVCNLKPAKMRGIVSEAMVLCATSTNGSIVELVMPPEGSTVGTRVVFEGEEGEPDAQLNPKKQIFEKIAVDFITTEQLVATWKGKPFSTPQGVCKVKSVKNGGIK
ncbi:hypothetical protein NDN08_003632 [Rhodosorus marinus]|uniref:tRNA-binding domain-containing protein n=1 Tax=Rhodosorus marinus TaxID=101924 RepID=A0AAV8UY57_9RHOD|nr:hypothetical protein NDN08_003632 [Rhodosorus marinus]